MCNPMAIMGNSLASKFVYIPWQMCNTIDCSNAIKFLWLPQPQCMHFAGWESVSLYGFAALVRCLISCTFMSFSVLLLLIDASIMSGSP